MKEILQDIKDYLSHYLVLFFILLFGGIAFFFFQKNPQAQIVSAFITATFYVLWGAVHHFLRGDLHLRVILEYFAVAFFGFLIIWSIIIRS